MRKFNPFLLIFLVPWLFSCGTKNSLAVRLDYLSKESLASYHVMTPDPLLACPPIGERLVVDWSVSEEALAHDPIELAIRIRLRNRTSVEERLPICESRGSFTYTLLNEEYLHSGGILAYDIQIVQNDQILDSWRHQIWAELILVDEQEGYDYDPDLCPEETIKAYEQGIDYDPATDLPPSTL